MSTGQARIPKGLEIMSKKQKRLLIKIRSRIEGGHIVDTIFLGPYYAQSDTLQNAGELRYAIPGQVWQWKLFARCVWAGCMNRRMAPFLVLQVEGDQEVKDQLDAMAAERKKRT